ncbi:hypothetical protein Tco_1121254 [Tanacetum coccineum]|uniref:Uncharacterized protein n=1 Tax=Tanacetum coccineum TaxID=301880 RepID=A0ABQ5IX60_9ASTR
MLLYSWDGVFDVCVDLTGSSPMTQTGLVDFVPGRAVSDAAHRKRVKYEVKCADIGYGFLPFSFSSFEELENDAVALLKRIRRFSVAQNIGARAAFHIFNRISFAVAKRVGLRDQWVEESNVVVKVGLRVLLESLLKEDHCKEMEVLQRFCVSWTLWKKGVERMTLEMVD